MRLFWHRRDLRLADNVGLARAADAAIDADDSVLPLVVVDPDVLRRASPPRIAFFLQSLTALRERYRDLAGDLLVRKGDPRSELVDVADDIDVTGVHWNRGLSGYARRRDEAVTDLLSDRDLEVVQHDDLLLQKPGSVLTNAGDTYQVFSPFFDKWRDREQDPPVSKPDSDCLASVATDSIPTLEELGIDSPTASLPEAGESAAHDRLEAFCTEPIFRYATDRDVPGQEGTSRLSPYLRFGSIGIRTVWAATAEALDRAPDEDAREAVWEFRRQLAFRDFYAHALHTRPRLVIDNAREYDEPIQWTNDPAEIRAWKDGETGYPIVDAGMRQLLSEAWMHNRVRMIVASFLTKDLLVDWREGYRWFRERLVDHDPANDACGWQWAASTGIDAQPYFRVFNPMTQGERYDPEATYIHQYVPALRDVDPELIHAWPELSDDEREAAAPDYPHPIVDHSERREAAIAAFDAARNGT